MTIEEKKRFLLRYQRIGRDIRVLQSRIAAFDVEIKNARRQQLTGMPRSGMQMDLSDMIARKETLCEDLQEKKRLRAEAKKEIYEVLGTMEDPFLSSILEMHYILSMPWEQIAKAVTFSARQIRRHHRIALASILNELKDDV